MSNERSDLVKSTTEKKREKESKNTKENNQQETKSEVSESPLDPNPSPAEESAAREALSAEQQDFVQRLEAAVDGRDTGAILSLFRQCRQYHLCTGKKRRIYAPAIRLLVERAKVVLQEEREKRHHEAMEMRARNEMCQLCKQKDDLLPFVQPIGVDRYGHCFFLFPHDYNNLFYRTQHFSEEAETRDIAALYCEEKIGQDEVTRCLLFTLSL